MNRTYLKLKACPRCNGDILMDEAIEDGEVCIQCGYRKFVNVVNNTYPQDRLEKTVKLVKGKTNSRVIANK